MVPRVGRKTIYYRRWPNKVTRFDCKGSKKRISLLLNFSNWVAPCPPLIESEVSSRALEPQRLVTHMSLEHIKDQFGYLEKTYTLRILYSTWDLFSLLWLPLLLGIAITGAMLVAAPVEKVRSVLGARRWWSIWVATALGTVSPLCTYLAVPLVAVLLRAGLPAAPLSAFLFSSPLMNPTLFMLTWGAMGFPMAMARLLSAIGVGLLAGVLVDFLARRRWISFDSIGDSDLERRLSRHRSPEAGSFATRWSAACVHLGWFTCKYFFLALLLASAVKELIPVTWVSTVVGHQHSYSVVVGMAMGIPLYSCGGGTIPFIKVLTDMGMDPGAALAFFVSGPATKVPTIAAVSATLKGRFLGFYLALMVGAALVAGLVYSPLAHGFGWTPSVGGY